MPNCPIVQWRVARHCTPQAHRDDWGKDLLDRVGRSFGAARVGGSGAWCGWKQRTRRSGSPTEEEKEKEKEEEEGGREWGFLLLPGLFV